MGEITTPTQREGPAALLVAISVLGGTFLWAGRFTVGYLLVPPACAVGTWLLHVVHVAFLVATIAVVILPLVLLKRATDTTTRFLLLLGLGLNAFFLATIALESSAALFIDPCAKGSIP